MLSLGPERSVPEVVARVRAHLLRRAIVAAGLWSIAALGVVLAVAWLAAGPEGWSQGSPGPLLLDLGARRAGTRSSGSSRAR